MRKTAVFNNYTSGWAIGGLLCLLGLISACGMADENYLDNENMLTDSTPAAVYMVKGVVTTKDFMPLEGIFVEVPSRIDNEGTILQSDTLFTNQKGEFEWTRSSIPKEQEFLFIFRDIDGEKNQGYFETDTTIVKFSISDLTEANINGPWDSGKAEKSITIRLKTFTR